MQVKSIAEHYEILLTFIQLPFFIKIFVLSIFEWPFYKVYCIWGLVKKNELVVSKVRTEQRGVCI